MKKFPSRGAMNRAKIYNSYGLGELAPQRVFICYSPQVTGRGYQSASFQVVRIGFATDPQSHWRDCGHKTFDIYHRQEKEAKLQEAIEWANHTFGAREWVRDPWGSYQDPSVIDLVWEKVKATKLPNAKDSDADNHNSTS